MQQRSYMHLCFFSPITGTRIQKKSRLGPAFQMNNEALFNYQLLSVRLISLNYP